MSVEDYGFVLIIMGIVNVIGVSFGNSLNNTRILLDKEFSEDDGAFNLIFLIASLFNLLVLTSISFIFFDLATYEFIGVIIISTLILFRSYYSVAYRIKIDYKKIFISNVYGAAGYLFGVLLTDFFNYWVLIFIFGELFAVIYILVTSDLVQKGLVISINFSTISRKYILLLFSALISTLITYMDRFYIYPVLGTTYVSIYVVSTFLGKTTGIILGPVSSVLLTYYVKDSVFTLKNFYKRVVIFSILSLMIYIVILIAGRDILSVLYPTISPEINSFFAIGNLGAIIFILGTLIQPTLLRHFHSKWQVYIQLIYFILYFTIGLFSMENWGLLGFCYGVMVSNTIRVLIMVLIASLVNPEK